MSDASPQTLGEVFARNAQRLGDKPAFVMPDGRSRSFRSLHERVARLNTALAARGLTRGDRVGILSRNRIEYVEGYGVASYGLIALPLNWRLTPRELQIVLQDARPAALLVERDFMPVIDALRPALAFVRHFIALDVEDAQWESYETLLHEAGDRPANDVPAAEETACLLYTSGTTGIPKGAELTHRGLLLNCERAIRHMFDYAENDVTLAPMPLFHVGGMWYHLFPSFAAGCTTIVMPQFDAQGVLELMAQHRVTNTHLVPTMIHTLLEQPNLGAFDLSRLRLILYAASSMPTDTLKRATATFACDFMQSYGSTEAGMITLLSPQDHRRATAGDHALLLSCGRPLPDVEVRIATPDAEADGIGEILVRSAATMARYWNNPQASAQVMRDGWLHTGDLGRVDAEGYCYILDRKSDMIVSGGENVYPREVEEVLLADADVAEAAVFDLPDPRWVQKVVVAVVLRSKAAAPDSVLARARKRLAGYKCPKEIFVTDTLPKNAAGKVLRKVLRETYAAKAE